MFTFWFKWRHQKDILKLTDLYLVIFIKILPVRLAFDAIEEVEPEVTAAAAAAIEVDVGKAVMDDAAEDDPGIQKSRKNSLN